MKKYALTALACLLALVMIRCTEDGGGSASPDKIDGATPGIYSEYGLSGAGGGSSSGNGDSAQTQPAEPGQITAAEWNDLTEWDFWKNLGQNEDFTKAQENWKFYLAERYSFLVTDLLSKPLIDCEVTLETLNGEEVWKARTDNEGRAELWLNINGQNQGSVKAVISYQNQKITVVDPKTYDEDVNEVVVATAGNQLKTADILFVVDATGSMGDEIEYLKSELLDVVGRAEDLNNQLSLRVGSVFYRDEGDEYLTRVSPFSTNLQLTHAFINNQHADGGGDYEEAVHTALSTAITQLSWSEDARARLIFLLLDAPPHHTNAIVDDLNESIRNTAAKGIKIIPVSASGINKDTEFLFRFFATATNGTYVFITNDSGIGGEHIEATVGDYEVELLNDLIVRLITKYTL
ncbi:MAG: VWA domain-containing protein [Bacteroidales bacterium]|nr:VWA domain-containing protein [Bacteroidales bacterium]